MEAPAPGILLCRVKPEEEEKIQRAIADTVADLETDMFLDGYHKAYGMGAGPCELCGKCDPAKPCEYRHRARPSMEACGIDVYQTVRSAGLQIEAVKSYQMPCTYCGLLQIE